MPLRSSFFFQKNGLFIAYDYIHNVEVTIVNTYLKTILRFDLKRMLKVRHALKAYHL